MAGGIGHGVHTSMIYVHTCALTGRTFSLEKHTLWAWMLYLNTFVNDAEGTIIIYSFIEYICYDLKDTDVNH